MIGHAAQLLQLQPSAPLPVPLHSVSPSFSSIASLLPAPPVTTSVPLSLITALSPPLPATPVIAALSVSSASLSSSMSSSSSPASSEELSSASSGHSNGSSSSSGASGSSSQSEQSAHRARAVYAENAYVSLLRNIEALSSQVQPPSPLAPAVPAVLTVALSETVQKAKEGWKKITKYRKRTKQRVSRGIERALKKEAMHSHSHTHPHTSEPHQQRTDAAEHPSEGKVRERKVDSGVGGSSSSSPSPATKRKQALAGKRKIRSATLPSSTGPVVVPMIDGPIDEPSEEEDNAAQGDDEGSGHTPDSDKFPAAHPPPPALALPSTAVPPPPPAPPHSLPVVLSSSSQSSPLSSSVYDSQAPVVMSCSKFPIAVLHVPVQRQYTMTRKDSKRIKREEKEALVNVSVRIMGTPDASFLYFVAKDVCQLICLRKGSVAKAIHDFNAAEKARMPVMCQRSSGSGCTQVLTVLTVAGVQRLMNASRQPIAKSVLQWIMEKIAEIQTEKKAGAEAIGAGNALTSHPPLTSQPSHDAQPQSAAALHRPPPQHEAHIPQMDGLSSHPQSMRGPTPLTLSMPQPSAFQSDVSSSDAFGLPSSLSTSAPLRSTGDLHSPSRAPFNASSAASLIPAQYLAQSAIPSFGPLSSPPFSTLPPFASSFNVNVLQSASSSRPIGSSTSQFPGTPPFSSFNPAASAATLSSLSSMPSLSSPFHQQRQPSKSQGQTMQQQSQQLLDALQAAHSQGLSMRYPISSSSMMPSSQSSPFAMAMFGLQAPAGAGGVHSQQPQQAQSQQQQQQQQHQQPLSYPLLPHLRLPQAQPPQQRQ